MLVEIKSDIFTSNNDSAFRHLLSTIFYKGRYELYIELPLIKETNAYKALPSGERIIIEGMFNKVINEGIVPSLTISEEDDETCYNFEEAIRFLSQPVMIILENSINDSHFLNAIMRCFDGELLLKHKNNGWLEFRNAGGANNIRNLFRGVLKGFRPLTKSNFSYIRAFVIMDSDKISPSTSLPQSKITQIEFLKENNISFHILEKREMENYLPNEVIDTIPDYRSFIDAYLRLNPVQKDYFDIEKGFPDRRFEQLNSEIQSLFDDVNDADKATFRKENLNSKYANFKAIFPRLFNHRLVTKKRLLERCKHHNTDDENNHPYNPNELPDLVKKISELL